ncbi:hypothetical protein [Lysinibacillus sphaericus]|uniref:hypothetical protein n=1 Tax=Lysinibacillus TaxID=400634 RepID=UPI0012BD5E9A|nr:hypothetical protein [Lysinibacillus sphaericus]
MATVIFICGSFLILDNFFNASDDTDRVNFANHQKLLEEVAYIDAQITKTDLSNKIVSRLNVHGYTLAGGVGYTIYPDKQVIALLMYDVDSMNTERKIEIQNIVTIVAEENGFHSFAIEIKNASKK